MRELKARQWDPSSAEYQRLSWEALRKSINGLINKVSEANIANIVGELISLNVIRGRGLLTACVLRAQQASPILTPVFAALFAIINSKFPELGELLLKRLIEKFRLAYTRNDAPSLNSAADFLAHLTNQSVASPVLALQIISLLLQSPTSDSVQLCARFVRACGAFLQEVSPSGLRAVFERLRSVLHEGLVDLRVQYTIEDLFKDRKASWEQYPSIPPGLDLLEDEDRVTHALGLNDAWAASETAADVLDAFVVDPKFEEHEAAYAAIKQELLGVDADGHREAGSDESDGEEPAFATVARSGEEGSQPVPLKGEVDDSVAAQNVVRRDIYLILQNSLSADDAAHKLMSRKFPDKEVAVLLLESCIQRNTYMPFYALTAQKFSQRFRHFSAVVCEVFVGQYETVHRLTAPQIRQAAEFFAQLMASDAMSWDCMSCISLTEEDTTSSSRFFIQELFQSLVRSLGLQKLCARMEEERDEDSLKGIFPKRSIRRLYFAINFFRAIGIGAVTEPMVAHLEVLKRDPPPPTPEPPSESDDSDSDDSSSSDSSSDTSTSSSSSD